MVADIRPERENLLPRTTKSANADASIAEPLLSKRSLVKSFRAFAGRFSLRPVVVTIAPVSSGILAASGPKAEVPRVMMITSSLS